MHTHDEVRDTLGAWALDACDADQAELIAAHLDGCIECRAEADRLRVAASWLGAAEPLHPERDLRERVLATARAVRSPGRPSLGALLAGYREQVAELSTLIGRLDRDALATEVPRHGTIRGLMEHLADNDRVVLTALADPAEPAPWREQAERLADEVDAAGTEALDRVVPLAGRGGAMRPVRAAVAQRVFETWTHADDVRVALHLPRRPPRPVDIEGIVALGTDLLPEALFRLGRTHPGRAARLVLTGSGGRRWFVPLATGEGGTGRARGTSGASTERSERLALTCAVVADAVDFCRLMAGRLPPAELPHAVDGDATPAADLLYAASTLGCD